MKPSGFKAISFFVVLALASLACSSVNSILNQVAKDDFSNEGSGWGIGTDSASSVEYADGGLHVSVFTPYYVTWSTFQTTETTDFIENIHVEVSVKNNSADPQALFGIVCHEQGVIQSFYYVGVSPDGYYAFIKSSLGQDDVFLKDGISELISAAPDSMRLGLDCGKDGVLTLYVNGQQIDTVSDSTYTSGVVGLFAATEDEANGADVTFDDFVITKLSK